ncbi:MAG: hypothetical protein ACTSU5_22590 [Promethearchaeota archaeon]
MEERRGFDMGHLIDFSHCKECETHDCVEVCFRHVFEYDPEADPPLQLPRRAYCVKCALCATACPYHSIRITW